MTAWIDTIAAKLRTALAHAAAGKPFDWEQLGPDPQFPVLPESLELVSSQEFTWPGPVYPDWPQPPGPDATYAEIKHYACIKIMAEAYLQCDQDSDLPEWMRLTSARAWTLAASVYRTSWTDERWDPYAWQPYRRRRRQR